MPSISGSSLLAAQAYATQTAAPNRPAAAPGRPALDGRAAASSAFSVTLSQAAATALQGSGDATFQPFVSAADMGARPAPASQTSATPLAANRAGASQDFGREAPLCSAEPPARLQRPGSQLDIRV